MNPVIESFVNQWKKTFNVSLPLTIGGSEFKLFDESQSLRVVSLESVEGGMDEVNATDLILGDLPLGLRTETSEFKGQPIRTRLNWLYILRYALKISPTGYGLFLLEPNAVSQQSWKDFEQTLAGVGLYLHAVFELPDKVLRPLTSITPILIALAPRQVDQLFVAKLKEPDQAARIVTRFANNETASCWNEGVTMPRSEFSNTQRLHIRRQIERLETQYKGYESSTFGDLIERIVEVNEEEQHVHVDNALYLFKLAKTGEVQTDLKNTLLPHRSYIQVILRDGVNCEYVAAYFRSDLGQLVLYSISKGTMVPQIKKADLAQLEVALPPRSDQEQIVSTLTKLEKLQSTLTQFAGELALNPTSSRALIDKLDGMMDSVGSLSLADRLRSLIRAGESKTVELKETLSLDLKTQKKEKFIETSVLKTVAAFLNTDGGTLLVGVHDNGEVPGLARELSKFHKDNPDKLLLHFKNILKARMGEEFYPFFDYQLVDMDGVNVLAVNCLPSKKACFLDGNDFYVRTNPATDKLEGPKLLEYVQAHFSE